MCLIFFDTALGQETVRMLIVHPIDHVHLVHSLAIPQRSSFYEDGMLLTEGIEHPHPVFWIHI